MSEARSEAALQESAGPLVPAAFEGAVPVVTAVAPPPALAAAGRSDAAPLSERVAIAVVTLGSITLLVLAASIKPDPSGVGTHQQLGLPPCGVMELTGWPCPSCGMTTAFAHAVRLHPWLSFKTQPLGFVLACCALVMSVVGPWAVWKGKPFLDRLPDRISSRAGWILLGAIAASWAYKAAAVKGVFGS